MGLRANYKQSDVGLIPEDWGVVEIGDLNPFVTSGSRGWAEFYSYYGSPFIRITNLSRKSIDLDLSTLKFVNLPDVTSEGVRTQLQVHDILISITADIGIIGYVGLNVPQPAYINQHIALVRLDLDKVDSRFVSYFLASEQSQRLFRAFTDTGAKAGMSLLTIQKLRLALPPLAEQKSIAAALSDVDALINRLDNFIAKKHAVKQGAMQELLTGRKRLPGFSDRWAVEKLGTVAEILKGSGLSKSKVTDSGSRKCILYGELFTTYKEVISDVVSKTDSFDGVLSKSGDVLMPGSTTTVGIDLATASALLEDNVALGGDINIIRQTGGCYDPAFFARYISYRKKQEIAKLAQGITIIHLYGKDLADLEIELPPLEEQQAIAAILADIDAEIVLLEIQRDKTRVLKQGMMQELLTGRIRLL